MAIDQIKIGQTIHDLGAKAENVSVDNSQTQFSSTNIQNTIEEIDLSMTIVESDIEENWNAQYDLIAKANHIYIYEDHSVIDGHQIPAIKIGDGTSYLIDMPFVNENAEDFYNHINNGDIHVTLAEKTFWNDKIRCYLSQSDMENLIFTTQ